MKGQLRRRQEREVLAVSITHFSPHRSSCMFAVTCFHCVTFFLAETYCNAELWGGRGNREVEWKMWRDQKNGGGKEVSFTQTQRDTINEEKISKIERNYRCSSVVFPYSEQFVDSLLRVFMRTCFLLHYNLYFSIFSDEINLCSVSHVKFEYEADLCGLLVKLHPAKQVMACVGVFRYKIELMSLSSTRMQHFSFCEWSRRPKRHFVRFRTARGRDELENKVVCVLDTGFTCWYTVVIKLLLILY